MDDQPQAEQQVQEASAETIQAQELEKLEESFAKVSSYKDPLQREQALAKESRDLSIPLDEYRRLYELSQKQSSTPTKLHKFWKWTGIGEKKGWDILQLLLIPIIIQMSVYQLQAEAKKREEVAQVKAKKSEEDAQAQIKQREKEAAEDRTNQETLNSYLSVMTNLLLELRQKPTDLEQLNTVKAIAKTRTVTALRALNGDRRNQLLVFLREANLIGEASSDRLRIDFRSANLRGVDLKDADLNDIDLSSVILAGADLRGAQLIGTDLSGADLTDAKLGGANLSEANLNAALGQINQVEANFCLTTMPNGKKSNQVCSTYIDARNGLSVRQAPAGYVIRNLTYGERIGLTGATQYAAGRSWSQISGGGWIASDYLSLQPSENTSNPAPKNK